MPIPSLFELCALQVTDTGTLNSLPPSLQTSLDRCYRQQPSHRVTCLPRRYSNGVWRGPILSDVYPTSARVSVVKNDQVWCQRYLDRNLSACDRDFAAAIRPLSRPTLKAPKAGRAWAALQTRARELSTPVGVARCRLRDGNLAFVAAQTNLALYTVARDEQWLSESRLQGSLARLGAAIGKMHWPQCSA